ncbi:MAG: four helix bundle protein [Draconibacterium sp.]
MEKKYLALDKISPYKKSYDLSNEIWKMVIKWDFFAKDTVGKQLVRSVDSISANIAEGFGRYHKKDKIKFYRIAPGSLEESKDWTNKSSARELIIPSTANEWSDLLNELKIEILHLIKFTNEKLRI